MVGIVRQNRRELPQAAKRKQQQHKTSLFTSTQTAALTLISYQCKKQKSVVIMSTLHPDVEIPSHNNPKIKSETVLFYNKTKVGVDIIDQMARKHSVKVASKRWPIHIFYSVIDLALINSWIFFQDICKSGISYRKFIQQVVEELTGITPGKNTGKNTVTEETSLKLTNLLKKKAKNMSNNKVP